MTRKGKKRLHGKNILGQDPTSAAGYRPRSSCDTPIKIKKGTTDWSTKKTKMQNK